MRVESLRVDQRDLRASECPKPCVHRLEVAEVPRTTDDTDTEDEPLDCRGLRGRTAADPASGFRPISTGGAGRSRLAQTYALRYCFAACGHRADARDR